MITRMVGDIRRPNKVVGSYFSSLSIFRSTSVMAIFMETLHELCCRPSYNIGVFELYPSRLRSRKRMLHETVPFESKFDNIKVSGHWKMSHLLKVHGCCNIH